MKTKIFILITFFLPLFVLATPTNYEGFEGTANAIGDFFSDIWSFLDDDVPNFFERMLAYVVEKITLMKIAAQLEALKLAWSVAKTIMENFQLASKVLSAANGLPQDVKAALVDMRFFDGFNIIIQALLARYVMRFI
ncbi:MAG TPA: DUF2523 domain-containing protein [Pseudoalteromonas prydzensis]|uniref:DUF2523 domain-containing protein n=2 Tax=root TaxID=1 RepID=A0A7V1D0I8_9GAMM|nr:DUF2523 family protein [Pseudoalteromonas prydzensis]HEA17629.1 DUF2523 domain-containing protein [Pseudoalteromonas prydzensis]